MLVRLNFSIFTAFKIGFSVQKKFFNLFVMFRSGYRGYCELNGLCLTHVKVNVPYFSLHI